MKFLLRTLHSALYSFFICKQIVNLFVTENRKLKLIKIQMKNSIGISFTLNLFLIELFIEQRTNDNFIKIWLRFNWYRDLLDDVQFAVPFRNCGCTWLNAIKFIKIIPKDDVIYRERE